jgi:hypothetical protein
MTRRILAAAATTVLLAASLIVGVATAGAKAKKGRADSGVAYFAITHAATNGTQYAAGVGHDRILGNVAAAYTIRLASSAGTVRVLVKRVVIYTGTGSLVGTASATVTFGSTGAETITGGKLRLTRGFGSQRGHSLVATFTGTGDTSKNMYEFHYTGIYR